MPYPVAAVDVEGDWRWDSRALDVQLFDGDLDTDWMSYDVQDLDVQPDVERLVRAAPPPLSISTPYTELPDEFPEWVEQQALEVTDGASSPFERAVKLQEWFRRDGGFEYSLDRRPGSSMESLELFLGTGPGSRVGYCEQFASAMTMMARSVSIPARIAIGFLRPDTTNDDSGYVYSTHDLHAWPELYFEGAGWIRFEPTPQQRATDVPPYTAGPIPAPPQLPTTDPSAAAEPTPTPTPRSEVDRESAEAAEDGRLPAWLLAVPAGVLLVVLALTPRWLRGAQRRRRYAGTAPDAVAEGAWSEVRATALDLGLGWDDGATLRTRALSLAGWLRSVATRRRTDGNLADREPAVQALERLVLSVERSRYSRAGLPTELANDVPELARTVTAAMRSAAPTRTRRRAEWLPASLWRGRRSTAGGPARGSAVQEAERERDRVSV
jgi:transglutaminase-like putative cysteine protease